jgi:preprotein translocase subunit SecA
VRQYVPSDSVEEQWDLPSLQAQLHNEWSIELNLTEWVGSAEAVTDEDVVQRVVAAAKTAFDDKVALVGEDNFTQFERIVLLQTIDQHWRDHLSALDYLRQGIHLRGYAQKQPKQEYKREAFELFGQLLDAVRNDVTRVLMNIRLQSPEQVHAAADDLESKAEHLVNVTYTAPTESGEPESVLDPSTVVAAIAPVGRNEPCPCGSGKKYKHCHGQLS